MKQATIWCIVIILLAGNIIGLGIGYVPVIIQSYTDGTNCTYIRTNANNCQWADDSICHWNGSACSFSAYTLRNITCLQYTSRTECEDLTEFCAWTKRPGESGDACQYQQGWRKTDVALVATMSVFGGIVGSILVHVAITKTGLNNAIALAAVVSCASYAFLIIGWRSEDDAIRLNLVFTGRFFTGMALGMWSAAVPMYVGDIAPRESAGVLGVCFQVFITFGIMLSAMVGFAANPSMTDIHARSGVEALNILSLVLSFILIPVSLLADKPLFDDATRNSLLTFRHSAFLRLDGGGRENPNIIPNASDKVSNSLFRRPLYVAIAVLIAAGQQLSGINMLISYVTVMASDIGLTNPYLGGFVVMCWNFVSTLFAIWLAKRMTAGNMFLLGEFITALSCFIIAVPVGYYSITDAGPQAVTIIGVAIFILAFELLGPTFYVLAQSMFPTEIRASGCSFTIFCQFAFNGVVNFLYPILVRQFSGGPSKPQNKGIAVMFFMYGGIGLVLTGLVRVVMMKIKAELDIPDEVENMHGGNETRDALTQY